MDDTLGRSQHPLRVFDRFLEEPQHGLFPATSARERFDRSSLGLEVLALLWCKYHLETSRLLFILLFDLHRFRDRGVQAIQHFVLLGNQVEIFLRLLLPLLLCFAFFLDQPLQIFHAATQGFDVSFILIFHFNLLWWFRHEWR